MGSNEGRAPRGGGGEVKRFQVSGAVRVIGIFEGRNAQEACANAARLVGLAEIWKATGSFSEESDLFATETEEPLGLAVLQVPRATFDALVAALRAVQWSKHSTSDSGTGWSECPDCGHDLEHTVKCGIGQALKLAEAVPR